MLWRYIKAQLFVLLCGGLVGPIFLAVYFTIGTTFTDMKWMLYTGIAIIVIDVLVAILIAVLGSNRVRRTEVLEQRGVLAMAQIVGIGETGTRVNNQPLIKLDLRVEGPGIAPFAVQDRVLASMMRMPSITSRRLVALVDPTTQDFQIDWERSALVNGLMPATFHIEEDNRTYDLTGQPGPLMEVMQLLKANNIAMDNMVDVRSNPVVRNQLRDIVRRAAGQSQPPGYAPPPAAPPIDAKPVIDLPPYVAPPVPSTAQRLQELETLRAMGTVSEDEYARKRQQIISEL